jgi:hypothetical protein
MLDDVRSFLKDRADDVGDYVQPRLDDLRTFLHDQFGSFEDWLGRVTVFEWVLLGLALALILWVVAKVRSATTLGPIEVATIEPAGGDGAGDGLLALTARLRDLIDEVGLRPPPDVPGGAPQANLLSAIEKSPIPQANWIATLMQAIPRPQPTTYKLTTTLLPTGEGVAFWLRPAGAGETLIETVPGNLPDVLEVVAERVLMHVSKDAVDIFPAWARWDSEQALTLYLTGIAAASDEYYDVAEMACAYTTIAQPDNAVARLRLLNAVEAQARADSPPNAIEAATLEASILRMYLDLMIQRPELVEARYRAGTLAASVASKYAALQPTGKDGVRLALEMTNAGDAKCLKNLRKIGRLGLGQALTQLQPWFAPLVWHRPRYAIEPRGQERRHLKRTLEISRRCQFARKYGAGGNLWTPIRRWGKGWVVRVKADRSGGDWQVHYNAGCFFALIERPAEAYRYLNRALDGGGYHKLVTWMKDDPDLAGLDDDEEWADLIARTGTANRASPWSEFRSVVSSLAAATLGVGLVIVLLAFAWAWAVVAVVLALQVTFRFLRYLRRERRLVRLATPPA